MKERQALQDKIKEQALEIINLEGKRDNVLELLKTYQSGWESRRETLKTPEQKTFVAQLESLKENLI